MRVIPLGTRDAYGDPRGRRCLAALVSRIRNAGWDMGFIAWIILGAIAGWLAGLLVKGDEGLGVIGHVVLGIVGAVVGGFLGRVLLGINPIDGALDLSSIVAAVIGAIIVVLVVSAVMGRTRTGRGPI